jgi:hypothetical protein
MMVSWGAIVWRRLAGGEGLPGIALSPDRAGVAQGAYLDACAGV